METTDGDLSFNPIIDEMICAAWYSVMNYHLHPVSKILIAQAVA